MRRYTRCCQLTIDFPNHIKKFDPITTFKRMRSYRRFPFIQIFSVCDEDPADVLRFLEKVGKHTCCIKLFDDLEFNTIPNMLTCFPKIEELLLIGLEQILWYNDIPSTVEKIKVDYAFTHMKEAIWNKVKTMRNLKSITMNKNNKRPRTLHVGGRDAGDSFVLVKLPDQIIELVDKNIVHYEIGIDADINLLTQHVIEMKDIVMIKFKQDYDFSTLLQSLFNLKVSTNLYCLFNLTRLIKIFV